jgi:hypothetical protein
MSRIVTVTLIYHRHKLTDLILHIVFGNLAPFSSEEMETLFWRDHNKLIHFSNKTGAPILLLSPLNTGRSNT